MAIDPINSGCYLIIEKFLVFDHPESGQLLEALESPERDQVVDEHIGQPEVTDEVHVDREPRHIPRCFTANINASLNVSSNLR